MADINSHRITLSKAVRLLGEVEPNSVRLCRTGMWLRAGTKVFLGGPVSKAYDHQVRVVRQVLNTGTVYFIIEAELDEDPSYVRPPTNPDAYIAVRPM